MQQLRSTPRNSTHLLRKEQRHFSSQNVRRGSSSISFDAKPVEVLFTVHQRHGASESRGVQGIRTIFGTCNSTDRRISFDGGNRFRWRSIVRSCTEVNRISEGCRYHDGSVLGACRGAVLPRGKRPGTEVRCETDLDDVLLRNGRRVQAESTRPWYVSFSPAALSLLHSTRTVSPACSPEEGAPSTSDGLNSPRVSRRDVSTLSIIEVIIWLYIANQIISVLSATKHETLWRVRVPSLVDRIETRNVHTFDADLILIEVFRTVVRGGNYWTLILVYVCRSDRWRWLINVQCDGFLSGIMRD